MMLLFHLMACPAPLDSDSAPPAEGAWSSVGLGLGPALLSVTGTGSDDVWITGADAGAGGTLLHFDGAAWSSVDVDGTVGDLWWASLNATSAWACGAAGLVLRHDLASGTTTSVSIETSATLYGIWAASDDDVWAVGGDPEAASDAAELWHRTGSTWTRVDLDPVVAAELALYKVWGNTPDDVWAVGSGGVAMHYDGAAWTVSDTVTTSRLFTVHSNTIDTFAVGGDVSGEVYHWSGAQWVNESPSFTQQFAGVYVPGTGDPVLVGAGGGVYTRTDGAWVQDLAAKDETFQDLHAVWVDPDGGVWAVGGHVSGLPLIQGVLLYRGSADVPTLEGI